ncbi:MAG: four helix bundle protein [Gemmatimonadaceae bacterium]
MYRSVGEHFVGIRNHRDLRVWHKAMDLMVGCYRLADALPREVRLDLGRQLRRAAGSIPANIAEGYGCASRRQYVHFISIARASLFEVDTHLEAIRRLGYAEPSRAAQVFELLDHTSRMLALLMGKLPAHRDPRQ